MVGSAILNLPKTGPQTTNGSARGRAGQRQPGRRGLRHRRRPGRRRHHHRRRVLPRHRRRRRHRHADDPQPHRHRRLGGRRPSRRPTSRRSARACTTSSCTARTRSASGVRRSTSICRSTSPARASTPPPSVRTRATGCSPTRATRATSWCRRRSPTRTPAAATRTPSPTPRASSTRPWRLLPAAPASSSSPSTASSTPPARRSTGSSPSRRSRRCPTAPTTCSSAGRTRPATGVRCSGSTWSSTRRRRCSEPLVATPNPTNGAATLTLTAPVNETSFAAAEFWLGSTDPGAGKGTRVPVSLVGTNIVATVPLAGIPVGSQQVNLRVQDLAGNWSNAVHTTVTVKPPNAIFSDTFDSGALTAWSARTGGVSVTAAAGIPVGGANRGLEVTLPGGRGNRASYVTDTTPNGETSYHASFSLNAGTLTSGSVDAHRAHPVRGTHGGERAGVRGAVPPPRHGRGPGPDGHVPLGSDGADRTVGGPAGRCPHHPGRLDLRSGHGCHGRLARAAGRRASGRRRPATPAPCGSTRSCSG